MQLRVVKIATTVVALTLGVWGCTDEQEEMDSSLEGSETTDPAAVDDLGTPGGAALDLSQAADQGQINQYQPSPIYFAFDRSLITDSAQEELGRLVSFLQENPSAAVQIDGHCDSRGSRNYNVALGLSRANSVKRFITQRGINDARITINSYGEERPAVVGDGEAIWSQNRRAVFVISNY
ncbi:MAG: OmpA family protein [Oligoflexales bacterium]